jgi:hypothetical protein
MRESQSRSKSQCIDCDQSSTSPSGRSSRHSRGCSISGPQPCQSSWPVRTLNRLTLIRGAARSFWSLCSVSLSCAMYCSAGAAGVAISMSARSLNSSSSGQSRQLNDDDQTVPIGSLHRNHINLRTFPLLRTNRTRNAVFIPGGHPFPRGAARARSGASAP